MPNALQAIEGNWFIKIKIWKKTQSKLHVEFRFQFNSCYSVFGKSQLATLLRGSAECKLKEPFVFPNLTVHVTFRVLKDSRNHFGQLS